MGITKADLDAQRAMLERGEEIRKAAEQAEERQRLRDTFAAAALTGLIANDEYSVDSTPLLAYRMADAMLRERASNHPVSPDSCLRNGSVEGCENEHYRGVEELGRPRRAHNPEIAGSNPAAPIHDAQPGARAEESMKEPNGSSTGEPGGEPESTFRTGNTWSPLWNPKHGEILPKNVIGVTFNEDLRKHIVKMGDGKTPWIDLPVLAPNNADPAAGSDGSHSEGSPEPSAWLVTGGGYEYVSLLKEAADSSAYCEGGCVVPLYRSPTLIDEEREAVDAAAWACGRCDGFNGNPRKPAIYKGHEIEATLRKLLQRLGGER